MPESASDQANCQALELAGRPAPGRLLVVRPPGLDRLAVVRLAPGAEATGLPGLVIDLGQATADGSARAARTLAYLAAELAERGELAAAVELTGASRGQRLTASAPAADERAALVAA